ncbi:hypothetical protein GCM10011609_38150 [Lentzea pudingi]|uniref:Integral membrane protein n=1 Tax=Lentzea pudingi TaxID=1789439 RepID=A0ABQ2I092_9PSEU|nr:hypothetical protein [Lentzea pudingi]GGM96749.1 hypothetical protein GCM10011609_38150 [Lentzea pudingi]
MIRVLLGAVAGAVAGVCSTLTLPLLLSPHCLAQDDWGCGVSRVFTTAVNALAWGIAGCLLLAGMLTPLKRPDAGTAFVLGCLFWPLTALALALLGLLHGAPGASAVPVLAFAVAAAVSGRRWSET